MTIILVMVAVCCLCSVSVGSGGLFTYKFQSCETDEDCIFPDFVCNDEGTCGPSGSTSGSGSATNECFGTTDNGKCIEYVDGVFSWTPDWVFHDIGDVAENKLILKGDEMHRDKCKDLEGQELVECASTELDSCINACDENDWCKGVKTSLNDHVKRRGDPLYCYFATDDMKITKDEDPGDNTRVGYIKPTI